MASPIIYFNNFIDDLKSKYQQLSIEDVKSELYKNSIMTKEYPEEQLLLVYHKYDVPSTSKLEQICRSLVIDITTYKPVSFSCLNPICNKEAQKILINNNSVSTTFYKCYEGSLMSLFYYNNKWYLSTRRCLNASESVWNEVSHYKMFMDVLDKENLTFDQFCEKLDKTKGYYFVLIHHNIKNVVNYTSLFGENYAKLCIAFVRDSVSHLEINDYELSEFTHIFKPEQVSIDEFSDENKQIQLDITSEGIITQFNIDDNWYLLKLQNLSYQFSKALGSESNIFKGYIYLYQTGNLKQYLSNSNHKNFDKIINPYNLTECFDTIGVIDAVFKVLTSEIFELFKMLWNLKTNEHLNSLLYNILPKEYKDVLFALRGIYFQIRTKNIGSPNKVMFGIKDIYNYLKLVDVEQISALLRQRKLMFNWIILDQTNEHLKNFKKISDKCDKVHSKLIAIYINKLFPEILLSDLPYSTPKSTLS
jgi:hypothetical protein